MAANFANDMAAIIQIGYIRRKNSPKQTRQQLLPGRAGAEGKGYFADGHEEMKDSWQYGTIWHIASAVLENIFSCQIANKDYNINSNIGKNIIQY